MSAQRKPRGYGGKLPEIEAKFIRDTAHFARREDVARLLDLPLSTVRDIARKIKRAEGRTNYMQPAALAETWRMFQAGEPIFIAGSRSKEPRLDWWEQGEITGAPGEAFTRMERIRLEDLAGTLPIPKIARTINRTAGAVAKELQRMGLGAQVFRNTLARLCRHLHIDPRCARAKLWARNTVLRCYRERRIIHVHIDDFDAMVESYWDADWHDSGVPKHPGKIRNRDEVELTDEERQECFE